MPVFLRWLLRLGPLNPIAVRLVQSGSRRPKHNLVRGAYLAVLIVVLLWMLLFNAGGGTVGYRELAGAGALSFIAIAYLQIALICVLAPVFMASAIAQEASPKTWDILLTTPLAPGQIVLGNLIGRLFFILALLVASLPLFALTQFFGGVPGRAIFTSYAIAGFAALLVGSIAIALSVSRLVGRRAVFAFYVAVVTYLAATAAGDALIRVSGGGAAGGNGVTVLTGLNPFLTLSALLNPSTYPRAEAGTYSGLTALLLETPVRAWLSLSGGLSVVLIALSGLTVRAGGLQTIAGVRTNRVPWYRKMMGLGAAGSEHRPPRTVGVNPIAWRESAARNSTFWKILARWSFVFAGVAGGALITILLATGSVNATTYRLILMSVVWTEAAIITLIAINMAATAVSREREDGTLDLILTTPVTPGAYLGGKLRGLVAYLLPLIAVPVVTLLIAGVYALATGATVPYGNGATAPLVLPEAGLVVGVVLLPFAAFCVMIGLQWSLKSKGTIGSVVATVAVVAVVAGTIGLCSWNSAENIQLVGPALGGLSPASTIFAAVAPERAMESTVSDASLASARVSLAIGAASGVAIFTAVIYGLHASLVRGFDFTVRKLAGTK
ncbi:MAG: hypothetical protein CMJ31_10165 [Phycisphaerae bacterium]|nr:hypothetical protein [Phycisphaerae bacterium]